MSTVSILGPQNMMKMQFGAKFTVPPHWEEYLMTLSREERRRAELVMKALVKNPSMSSAEKIGEFGKALRDGLEAGLKWVRENENPNATLIDFIGTERAEKEVRREAYKVRLQRDFWFRLLNPLVSDWLDPSHMLNALRYMAPGIYILLLEKEGGFEWMKRLIDLIRHDVGFPSFADHLRHVDKLIREKLEQMAEDG